MKRLQLALYGELSFDDIDDPLTRMQWQLFQTAAVSRLRDISLSSTPSIFLAQANPAHRFHHSVGVAHLASEVCRREGRDDLLFPLVAAALLHDSGAPPFSHIAESFQFAASGSSHESLARTHDDDVTEILSQYSVDPQHVSRLILGEEGILAGSLDLDNIDNSLHLLLTFGFDKALPYSPMDLASALRWHEGAWHLDTDRADAVWGWKRGRERLYTLLAQPVQLASATMLYTAIEDAWMAGALPDDYFSWGEGRALAHLEHSTTADARALVQRASSWRQYPRVYMSDDARLLAIADLPQQRHTLRLHLAESLGVPADNLCIYIGRSRGFKAITLPWVGESADTLTSLFAEGDSGRARICVFLHKDHIVSVDDIDRALAEYEVQPRTPQHYFF